MNLNLFFDHRFYKNEDDIIFSQQNYNFDLFESRYLKIFQKINIVARVKDMSGIERNNRYVEGHNVTISSVGNWNGLFDYIKCRKFVKKKIFSEINFDNAAILIAPSLISNIAYKKLSSCSIPYAVEVVGDPFDVFSPGTIKHFMRPFLRFYFTKNLKNLCKNAIAVSYVTKSKLQKRYPCNKKAFTANYSSIELKEDSFAKFPKIQKSIEGNIKIIFVGYLQQLYKAPDILIKSVHTLVKSGLSVKLIIIGDGKYKISLIEMVKNFNLQNNVSFLGHLPAGVNIRKELDNSDLFVLPSRTEGLPRSMLEAMARGLPCIGSTAGGIPELLPEKDLVPPGDVDALANKIIEVISDPERMNRMAKQNLEKAKEYREDILRERRIAFYGYIKQKTEEWKKEQKILS